MSDKLQLSGIRKTAATLLFAKFYKEIGDYHIAANKVQRRFKHASPWMTMHHYVDDMKSIEALKYCDYSPWELLYGLSYDARQTKLEEFH